MLVLIGLSQCSLSPGFSETPEIEFIALSKDTIIQDDVGVTDSLLLKFSFRDGDGDFGTEAPDITQNIVLTDSRTNQTYDRFKIPPLIVSGAMTGIEGEITIKVFTTCCIFPPQDTIPACESPEQYPFNILQLDIQMTDDSGKMSNTITSPEIILLCN